MLQSPLVWPYGLPEAFHQMRALAVTPHRSHGSHCRPHGETGTGTRDEYGNVLFVLVMSSRVHGCCVFFSLFRPSGITVYCYSECYQLSFLTARFESYEAGSRLRLGWARRCSMR